MFHAGRGAKHADLVLCDVADGRHLLDLSSDPVRRARCQIGSPVWIHIAMLVFFDCVA
jgi:hypothetical protein